MDIVAELVGWTLLATLAVVTAAASFAVALAVVTAFVSALADGWRAYWDRREQSEARAPGRQRDLGAERAPSEGGAG